MLFTWFLLGGLICLFAPASLTGKLKLAYNYVFSWPLDNLSLTSGAMAPLNAVDNTRKQETADEQQRLENHIANLQAQVRDAQDQIAQLQRLRAVPQWDRMSFVLADVTRTSQTQDVLFINRGRKDHIAVGQYVLGDMSVIGTISDVWAQRAVVKLITERNSKIPATIGESDLARVMKGQSGNTGKIRLVSAEHTVRVGDKVYARKVPGLLDVSIIAAKVAQCGRDPEDPSMLDITIQPVCDIANLTRVAVIVPAPQQ
jgi:cell shape-determining protein MreC